MKSALPKRFLQIDLGVQIFLVILIAKLSLISLFLLFGFLLTSWLKVLLILLGIWQLLSAIYLGFFNKNSIRQMYLLVVMIGAFAISLLFDSAVFSALISTRVFIILACFEIRYLNKTYKDWKNSE